MNSLSLVRCLGAVVLLSCALPSNAGVNAWTVSGPEGGFAKVVAPNPTQPSTVLASTFGGTYRTTDGGANWSLVSQSLSPYNFAFDPTNPNRVFAGSGGLIRSDDGGQSFALVPASHQPTGIGAGLTYFNRDGSYLFVQWGAKLARTPDLGANWTDVSGPWPSTEGIEALGVDPNDANTLYVAIRGSGVYKSTNAGNTWAPTGAGPASGIYLTNNIVVKPGDSSRVIVSCYDGIYVSANGGTSWAHPYTGGSYGVAISPTNTQTVAALAYTGTVMVSSDNGDTFPANSATPLRIYYQVTNPVFDPATVGKLWVASGDGPLLSTDSGATFARRTSGMRAESLQSLTASDDGAVYALFSPGPAGVFKHVANGWQAVNNASLMNAGLFSLGYGGGPLMYEVAVAPQNSNFLYAVFYNDAIVKSVDGGANWTYAGSPVLGSNKAFRHIAIDPSNTNVAYAGSQNDGVWKTTDGGQNWNKSSIGLPLFIYALTIDRANPQVVYAAALHDGTTSVFKTVNGGTSWSPTGALPNTFSTLDVAIDPADSKIVYASAGGGLYKSVNSGGTWNLLSFGSAAPGSAGIRVTQVDAAQPTTLISGVTALSGGFLRSVDAGATWQRTDWSSGISTGNGMETLVADPVVPGRVFSGGHGTGIAEYQVAPDLGVSASGDLSIAAGTNQDITYTVTNLGLHAASAPRLQMTVPTWITPSVPAGCNLATHVLTCDLPALPASQSRDLVVALSAEASSGSGAVAAQLQTHEMDPVSTNNSVSINVSATAPAADLQVSAGAGTRTMDVAKAASLTLTVTNQGPQAATGASVSIAVPSILSFGTATATAGTCSGAGTVTITCNLGTLAKDASVTISLSGTGASAGSAAVTVTVQSTVADGVTGNNTASASFTVTTPPAAVGPTPTPPKKGGGGGSYDALALLLLGVLFVRRLQVNIAR